MNWRISPIVALGLLLLACNEQNPEGEIIVDQANPLGYVHTRHLVQAEDLIKWTERPNQLELIDLRTEEQYVKGHIKGAHQVWRSDLTDTNYAYPGMMGSKEQIADLLGSLGITHSDTLVLYDDRAAANAARLWWILKVYGHESMVVLNGGSRAWIAAGGGLTSEVLPTRPIEYQFPEQGNSALLSHLADIKEAGGILLDTRTLEEHNGEVVKNGAAFAGTIKGALHLDFDRAINYNEHEVFHSADSLRKLYASIGIDGSVPVITFCQSGVRSAHTLFVLTELLGYERVSNYDGSWIEWSYWNDPDRTGKR